MTRVVIISGGHEVQIECEGSGASVMKLAMALWEATREPPGHFEANAMGFVTELAPRDDGDCNAVARR